MVGSGWVQWDKKGNKRECSTRAAGEVNEKPKGGEENELKGEYLFEAKGVEHKLLWDLPKEEVFLREEKVKNCCMHFCSRSGKKGRAKDFAGHWLSC